MTKHVAPIALLATALGCTGVVGQVGGASQAPGGAAGKAGEKQISSCTSTEPTSSPLRRLTRFELNRTVEDLFGDTTSPAAGFPPDHAPYGFDNAAESYGTSPLLAEAHFTASEQIAARAMLNLPKFFSCDAAKMGDAACGGAFVEQVGRRVWRRPLDAAELTGFRAAYSTLRANNDHTKTLELLLHALLASPYFLYRIETAVGANGAAAVAPDGWEMASRLSYLLWSSTPDAELLRAAERGELATAAQLQQQVDRMLTAPRAQTTFQHFVAQWLGVSRLDLVEKDAAVYPSFTTELPSLLRAERDNFLNEVLWNGDGTLTTLLTAPYTFVNERLAQFYGLKEGPKGDTFKKVSLDPSSRGGLLTQAGLLAVHAKSNQSSPVARGKFIREALLCTHPPAPPSNLDINPPDLDPKLTTRERFAQHATDPGCRPCHQLMDPLGLAFENYDGIGHWRSEENGQPVDASGELIGTDVDGAFVGAVELGHKLGGSAQVSACAVSQWFRFATGRPETEADACDLDRLKQAHAAGRGSFRALIAGTVHMDAFRYRRIQSEGPKQ